MQDTISATRGSEALGGLAHSMFINLTWNENAATILGFKKLSYEVYELVIMCPPWSQ